MDRVWYVAYGSNLARERFACYLEGGRPAGGSRVYAGCRDSSAPRADAAVEVTGGLVFAGESLVWGGGVAFFEPAATASVAGRAYLLTVEQFADVVAQEMREPPGGAFADSVAAAVPGLVAGGDHALGLGRYEALFRLGERDGLPMVTATAGDLAALKPNAPAAAYLGWMAAGLRESHRWGPGVIADYLAAWPGARPAD